MHQAPTTFEVEAVALRKKRMQRGISIAHLAEQVGCSDSYLRKLENGTRRHVGPEIYIPLRTALAATDKELLAED
ncbi:helix-turn-helix domain-containing protein [Streptomyces erythrochromogenes]|uniref:helix-turn-helix domain-containing protein n=1 Tax=Streptomyces erythrochromogenes TaxID=285574 RepID=UPI00363B94E2